MSMLDHWYANLSFIKQEFADLTLLWQSFAGDAKIQAEEAAAKEAGIDWEAPESDVLEVLGRFVPSDVFLMTHSYQRFGISMFILSGVLWILSWIFVTCLNLAAARQVRVASNFAPKYFTAIIYQCQVFRIRGEFLRAVLRQDVGWYDTNTTTDFASRLTE